MSANRPHIPDFRLSRPSYRKPASLTIQKLIDGKWVTTASASDLEAAERHSAAVGGTCRALDAAGETIGRWEESTDA